MSLTTQLLLNGMLIPIDDHANNNRSTVLVQAGDVSMVLFHLVCTAYRPLRLCVPAAGLQLSAQQQKQQQQHQRDCSVTRFRCSATFALPSLEAFEVTVEHLPRAAAALTEAERASVNHTICVAAQGASSRKSSATRMALRVASGATPRSFTVLRMLSRKKPPPTLSSPPSSSMKPASNWTPNLIETFAQQHQRHPPKPAVCIVRPRLRRQRLPTSPSSSSSSPPAPLLHSLGAVVGKGAAEQAQQHINDATANDDDDGSPFGCCWWATRGVRFSTAMRFLQKERDTFRWNNADEKKIVRT